MVRRRWSGGRLPGGFVPTVAVTLFGAAGAGLAWLAAIGGTAGLGGGAGFYASGAIASLAAAAAFVPASGALC